MAHPLFPDSETNFCQMGNWPGSAACPNWRHTCTLANERNRQLFNDELRLGLPYFYFSLERLLFRLGVLTYSYFVRATTIEVNGTTLYSDFWGSEAGGILHCSS
jgi:hypothetical protein